VLSAARTEAEEATDNLNILRVKEIGYLALHETRRPIKTMISRRLRAKYKKKAESERTRNIADDLNHGSATRGLPSCIVPPADT
jgi:hypothetical protein